MFEVGTVEVAGRSIYTVLDEQGEPRVVVKYSVESMGVDYSAVLKRLRRSSWSTMAMTATVAEDGKTRKMATLSIDAWIMLLATIDETRVAEHLRPMVIEFQKESAKALRDYWGKGVAINHRISDEQLIAELEKVRGDLVRSRIETSKAQRELRAEQGNHRMLNSMMSEALRSGDRKAFYIEQAEESQP